MKKLAFILACVLGMGGCATVMQGTRQNVGISSIPSGAAVTIDGQNIGKTPVSPKLTRKEKHLVRVELEGYQPYETYLVKKTSGWVFGNLVFGMLPGLVIDSISGGLYKLNPEQVEVRLEK